MNKNGIFLFLMISYLNVWSTNPKTLTIHKQNFGFSAALILLKVRVQGRWKEGNNYRTIDIRYFRFIILFPPKLTSSQMTKTKVSFPRKLFGFPYNNNLLLYLKALISFFLRWWWLWTLLFEWMSSLLLVVLQFSLKLLFFSFQLLISG